MPRENVDNQVLSSVAHKKIIKFTKKMLQRYGAKNYPVEKLISLVSEAVGVEREEERKKL